MRSRTGSGPVASCICSSACSMACSSSVTTRHHDFRLLKHGAKTSDATCWGPLRCAWRGRYGGTGLLGTSGTRIRTRPVCSPSMRCLPKGPLGAGPLTRCWTARTMRRQAAVSRPQCHRLAMVRCEQHRCCLPHLDHVELHFDEFPRIKDLAIWDAAPARLRRWARLGALQESPDDSRPARGTWGCRVALGANRGCRCAQCTGSEPLGTERTWLAVRATSFVSRERRGTQAGVRS